MTVNYATGFPANPSGARFSRLTSDLRDSLTTLQTEVVTGLASDPGAALRGRTSEVHQLEANLATLARQQESITAIEGELETEQAALASIRRTTQQFLGSIETVATANTSTSRAVLAETARNTVDAIASTLNSRFAGRALFAGNETDGPATLTGEEIIATVTGAITGATDLETEVRAFFSDPGGLFETSIYLGGTADNGATEIAEDRFIEPRLRADATMFRELLSEATILAIKAGDGVSLLTPNAAEELRANANVMRESLSTLEIQVGMLGIDQQTVASAKRDNIEERVRLEISVSDLIGRDQAEVATSLEVTQTALETLFLSYSRTQQLSLTRYL